MRAGFGSPRHLGHYTRGHQCLPPSCCWCRRSERHFAADLGRLGSLMVWCDAATGTWSAFVLGTQRTGFSTAAAPQAAALRMARAQLEEGLGRIEELEPAGHDAGARIS